MPMAWLKRGHPIAQIYVSAFFVTLSELALKIGVDKTALVNPTTSWIGIVGLESPWVWAGVILGIISMVAWLAALRRVPLSVAFLHSNVVYVTVPACCWLFLGESISPQRWLGTIFVLASIMCIAKPLAKIEEQT